MKKQQRKLDFRKESILELTDSKLQSIDGGGGTGGPGTKTSFQVLTVFCPPLD